MNEFDDVRMNQKTEEYLQLAGQMLDEAFGEERQAWIERMEVELPQIRAAFDWLAALPDGRRGLRLAYLLQEIWFEEAYTEEGLALLQRFLQLQPTDEPDKLRALCLDLAGAFAISLGEYDLALAVKEQAVSILHTLGDETQLAYTLLHLGHLTGYAQGDYAAAQRFYLEALGMFNICQCEDGLTHASANLANVAVELGNVASARVYAQDSLRRYRELDLAWELAQMVNTAAAIATASGDGETAVTLAAASVAHRQRIGVSMPEIYQARYRRIEAATGAPIEETEHQRLWQVGQKLSLDDAVTLALKTCEK